MEMGHLTYNRMDLAHVELKDNRYFVTNKIIKGDTRTKEVFHYASKDDLEVWEKLKSLPDFLNLPKGSFAEVRKEEGGLISFIFLESAPSQVQIKPTKLKISPITLAPDSEINFSYEGQDYCLKH